MSSTLVTYAGKQVWIHNAVGEVWLYALGRKLKAAPDADSVLRSLSDEIDSALSAGWVVGPLQHDFDRLLIDTDRKEYFLTLVNDATEELRSLALPGNGVRLGNYSAASEFLMPEMAMLQNLFGDSELVPSPAHIYVLGKGWTVA